RRAIDRAAVPLEHAVRARLHAGAGTCELAVRFSHLRAAAADLPSQRGALPDGLVRGVARDASPGDLRHSHAGIALTKPAASAADGNIAGSRSRGGRAALHADRRLVWLRAAADGIPAGTRRDDSLLPDRRRARESV